MSTRRCRGWLAGVAIGVVLVTEAGMPASAIDADQLPHLWGGSEVPADLVEHSPSGGAVTDDFIDGLVAMSVDVTDTPGPTDVDGCGELPLQATQASVPGFDPRGDGSGAPDGTYDSARICDGPDGPATIVELTGHTQTGGALSSFFARPSAGESFHSMAFEYRLDFCYVTAPVAGFPAAPGTVGPYLEQAWNLADDPAVDCSSRTVTTTTVPTTATTTSSPTSSTIVAVAPAPGEAPPAAPVSGTASFTG